MLELLYEIIMYSARKIVARKTLTYVVM